MKQALKAGLNAATISIVLRTAPEIINAIKYLIENGEVDEEQFKKIGFAALKGGSEKMNTIAIKLLVKCKYEEILLSLIFRRKTINPSALKEVEVCELL